MAKHGIWGPMYRARGIFRAFAAIVRGRKSMSGIPYPSSGAPTPFNQFVRRTELYFDDLEAWQHAYRSNPHLWDTASERTPGFGPFESMLLDEEPQFDLLRDAPQQHYKYMSLQLWWPNGVPEIDEDEEIFIDSYCLFYRPRISCAMARTGTSATIRARASSSRDAALSAPGAQFAPPGARLAVSTRPLVSAYRVGDGTRGIYREHGERRTRIRFTWSPHGAMVIGGWLNISPKQKVVDDFLK